MFELYDHLPQAYIRNWIKCYPIIRHLITYNTQSSSYDAEWCHFAIILKGIQPKLFGRLINTKSAKQDANFIALGAKSQ